MLLFFFCIRHQCKQNFCNCKKKYLHIAAEINELNFFFEIFCDECLKFESLCAMAFNLNEFNLLKYSECLHLNCFYSFHL